jgi:hypothetical protein
MSCSVVDVFNVSRKIALSRNICDSFNQGYNQPMEPIKRPRGRPPAPPEAKQEQRSIRLTPDLWAKIDTAGMDWLRKVIKRAKIPK